MTSEASQTTAGRATECGFKWCRLPPEARVHALPYYHLNGTVGTMAGLDGRLIPKHPFRTPETEAPVDADAEFGTMAMSRTLSHLIQKMAAGTERYSMDIPELLTFLREHRDIANYIGYLLYWAGVERGRATAPSPKVIKLEPEPTTAKPDFYAESCPVNPRDLGYG